MKAILTYHSIDDTESVVSVSAATLRRHARWLADAGLRAVSLDALLALPAEDDAVAITFDDAFANFATRAWPILRDHGHAVTLFVPTGYVGRTNAWERGDNGIPVVPLLHWTDLGRLAAEGVTLGAHSETHPDLTMLGPDLLRREVAAPIEHMRSETGIEPAAFAYPYGAVSATVVECVRNAYRLAVTTDLRWLGRAEEWHRLPRLDAYYLRRPGALERFGSDRFRRWLQWRRTLRRARRGWMGGV
ncbi:MAG: polysaccharide deacetylase family protein [Longimicrobiales bacterium]